MTITIKTVKTAAVLVALAVTAAVPARAQRSTDVSRAADDTRSYGAVASVHNARLMNEIMREYGIDPERLGPAQAARIDEVRYRLFPDAEPRRQRLSRTQALAVVYVALVYPRERRGGGGGGWNDGVDRDRDWDRDRDRDWDRDRPRGNRQCAEVDRGVYELLNITGVQDPMLFLNDEEKVRVRTAAVAVQRAAIDGGLRQVADRAAEVIALSREMMPDRDAAADRVAALKSAADQACDRGTDRR